MKLFFRSTVMFVLYFVLVIPLVLGAQEGKRMITLNDVTSYHFFSKLPRGVQWLPNGQEFSYLKMNKETRSTEFRLYNAKKKREKVLLTSSDLTYIGGEGDTITVGMWRYQWLPEENGLIFIDKGDVWYYSLSKKHLKRLTDTEETEEMVDVSPDGKYVSYVRENNLYVMTISGGREIQLTSDGSDVILNGKLDWVYQEELVGRGNYRGYFWSPNSDRIAYLRFDQSPVPEYPLVDWAPYHPEVEMMHYPKAGDPNAVVKLGVVSIEHPETVWMDTGENTDVYFPRVFWTPSGKQVAFMRLDRHQQKLDFLFADPATGKTHLVLHEEDPYWINIEDFVYFFKNKEWFLWGSERSGYNHLYLYDYRGNLIRQLTSGNWQVTQLAGEDEKDGWIYFTATKKSILERQLYRVKINGQGLKQISEEEGSHSVRMAPGGNFYLDYYGSATIPMEVSLHRNNGKRLTYLLEDKKGLHEYDITEPEYFTFTGDNGIEYYATMIKPLNFDPKKKYPVLIYVYGGPHAQVVRKGFSGHTLWHQMLAEQGYLIFSMDNRGAYGRGHGWETPIYKQMGKLELEDQLRGVAYLKSLPYVDEDRIGIWGWSYGGYMTLYALTHSDVFRTGISVAPVTHWRFYDTIYTERYMGLPRENEAGYRDSAPLNMADSLSGQLLLIHGTGDDNVHMQNSIQMVDKLVDAGKQFQVMFYPKQRHGISGNADRQHLYRLMKDFLDTHLKGE